MAAANGDDQTAGALQVSLPAAGTLSAIGGYLDAFTWLTCGGVFATAQTGNVVLLGVYVALGRWTQALDHLLPIAAFVLGVLTTERLRARLGKPGAALLCLTVEIVLLSLVMVQALGLGARVTALAISFVAALQNSSFDTVNGWRFNSVITTGNLQQFTRALVAGMARPSDRQARRHAQVFATICTTFGLGAVLGAFATHQLGRNALAAPAGLLLVILAFRLARTRSPLVLDD